VRLAKSSCLNWADDSGNRIERRGREEREPKEGKTKRKRAEEKGGEKEKQGKRKEDLRVSLEFID
jgi:hypothetical protein